MDLRPWNYWTRDGKPHPETTLVQASLEQVLAAHKNHPGALHLWIHLWEATDTPERAEAEADRLLPLMPGAGHIVHMPAHIYQRVGRHADVISSNLLAAKADEDYIAQCRAQGLYPLGYYPHNLHFIWMGATASGQRQLALDSARRLADAIPAEALGDRADPAGLPRGAVLGDGAVQRMGSDPGRQGAASRHGVHTRRVDTTRGRWRSRPPIAWTKRSGSSAALKTLVADPSLKGQTTFSSNSGLAILRIAPEVIAGEIAAKRKDWDRAVLHLDRAVRFEDSLIYQEPHDWHAPARQNLAAVLLAAGRADEAETVLWEDLKRNPEHGWTLSLLARALRAQDKNDEAARSRRG